MNYRSDGTCFSSDVTNILHTARTGMLIGIVLLAGVLVLSRDALPQQTAAHIRTCEEGRSVA